MAWGGRASLALIAILFSRCSGTVVETPPPFDPAGEWFGVWVGENGSGALEIDFVLEASPGGSSQVVALSARGDGCSAAGDIGDGSFSRETDGVSFFVTVRDAASSSQAASGMSFVGRGEAGYLEGTYTTEAFGSCEFCACAFGPSGSWSAVRLR